MPIFVYVVVRPDGSDGETLEIEQGAGDAPLTKHPLTGAPLRRAFSAPGLVTRYSEFSAPGLVTRYSEGEMKRKSADERYFAARGFTKYERDPATGVYHKTAGTDPNAPESFRKPSGNELLPHEDSLLHGESCSCAACRRGKK